MTSTYTPVAEIAKTVNGCRQTFLKGITLGENFRKEQLQQLYKLINENSDDIIKAIQGDMSHRPTNEIILTEISPTLSEVAHLMNNLNKYMTPKKVSTTAAFLTDSPKLYYTPRGVACIIGPWNFPFSLVIQPLAGAIAAGCTVILKPSEVSGNVANIINKLIPKYLDNKCYKVITGAVSETTELLKQKFDVMFFTGSCSIGTIVAQACAKHLTPCILELGGQNPVIVDDGVDYDTVARRIAFGRWTLNCGQVCLAPEYILINKKNVKPMIDALKKAIKDFFGDNPQLAKEFARIINKNHFNRVKKVLDENKHLIVHGGETDESENYIAPTILSNVSRNSKIMHSEVFGPLISIYPVENLSEDSLKIIHSFPKPLAMYIFSNKSSFVEHMIKNTDSGGVTVNDTLTHYTFPNFPFGGTGASGVGSYHGWYSFQAFSHERPVLHKYAGGEKMNDIRSPPIDDWKVNVYRSLMEEKPSNWTKYFSMTPMVAVALGGTAYWLQSRL